MNPASLSGAPSDACTLGTQGAFGADRITKRVYDTASRVTQTISAFGTAQAATQTATYYNYGPIKFATDGNGNQSYFTYDSFTRPERTYYPKASSAGYNASDYVQYYYDSYGRQDQVRQRDGENVYFSFDDHGRTTLINAPGTAEDTTLDYDIMGNVTSVSKTGQSLTYSYDGRGLLTGETSSIGTVSYVYDNYGRRTRMNYPGADNFYVTYEHQTVGGLGTIKEKGSATLASFSYDSQGRRDILTFNGSTSKSYSYDAMSRLTSINNNLSGTSMDQTLSFTRSPSGQIATQTNSNTAYDPIPTIYDVDSIINGLNQITSQTGTSTFTYDTAGNLTSGAGNTYGYDYANRLTSTSGTSGAGTLTYDPASRLRTLTSGGVTTSFLYDGQNIIAEYEGGVLVKRYVHGPGSDEPLVEYTGSGTSSKVWLISDSRGSITGHVNGSGTSVATNSYGSYGMPGTSNTGRFQYTGQMYLEEIGLYYYKARFYSADLKRFLQTDPIGYGDGLNMYAYVGGDPMNFTDPSGLTGDPDCRDEKGLCYPEDIDEITSYGTRINYSNFVVYAGLQGSYSGGSSRSRGGGANYTQVADASSAQSGITCPDYNASDNNDRGFPNVPTSGERELKARGLFGPRLYGPFSTYDGAVQSALGAFSTGLVRTNVTMEGVTIFWGHKGYFRSRISAAGFNQGAESFPSGAGAFSSWWHKSMDAMSTVTNVRNNGSFIRPNIGIETIILVRSPTGKSVKRCRN